MERIIIRHLSGSKANQVEEFPLSLIRELILGRDPSATIQYDPDRDDLVGRRHARIAADVANPFQFTVTDLNSRNGTFVNRQRIAVATHINPGDLIQLGAGGPEFQFDLEPRPENTVRPTRVDSSYAPAVVTSPVPLTRVSSGLSSSNLNLSPAQPMTEPPAPFGKATVERLIVTTQSETRKQLIIAGTVIVAIIAIVAGYLIYSGRQQNLANEQARREQTLANEQALREKTQPLSQVASDVEALKKRAAMSPAEISAAYSKSVVQIEVAWKLVETGTGAQVYHLCDNNGAPVYVQFPDGSIEPLLTNRVTRFPIAGRHIGSGFVVTDQGYIMTNRHVAATWHTSYNFPAGSLPGILVVVDGAMRMIDVRAMTNFPGDYKGWVPANARIFYDGQSVAVGRQIGEKKYEGQNIVLDVAFPNKSLRTPAILARVSEHHDVAIIKVNIPVAQENVPQLFDNYDEIKVGDSVLVLGYPAVSPPVVGVINSRDVFNRETQAQTIPNPTLSVGNIGRILRGNERPTAGQDPTYSIVGDAYQLTINSTGEGNSGGPVFDDHGRVTGIFYARNQAGGATVTFAVPVRFGNELMR